MIVIRTSDGEIMMANNCQNLKCDFGCFAFYNSQDIELLGVFIPTSGSMFIGFKSINPELGTLPTSSVKAFRHGGIDYGLHKAVKLTAASLTAVAITNYNCMHLMIVSDAFD